jgi:hypothetical protein
MMMECRLVVIDDEMVMYIMYMGLSECESQSQQERELDHNLLLDNEVNEDSAKLELV